MASVGDYVKCKVNTVTETKLKSTLDFTKNHDPFFFVLKNYTVQTHCLQSTIKFLWLPTPHAFLLNDLPPHMPDMCMFYCLL